MNIKRWIGVVILGLAVAALACGGEQAEPREAEEGVDVLVSRSIVSHGIIALPATVLAAEQARLATRISGTVRRMAVDIGSRVSAGQVLAQLDTDEIEARIRSAEAAARLAQQYHARIASLATDGVATEQELDEATARRDMAEAAVRDARAQRAYVILRAPFDGVVTVRTADPGDLAVPGVPILELITTTGLKVQADLPAELANTLAVGDRIMIQRPRSTGRHPVEVVSVVPALDQASRRFRIEARLTSGPANVSDLRPGTFVRIELPEPTSTTRWIPADAVVERGQLTGVFLVVDGRLRLRWVRLGQKLNGSIELLAGPTPDLLVVREPKPGWLDGQMVRSSQQVEWLPSFLEQMTISREDVR